MIPLGIIGILGVLCVIPLYETFGTKDEFAVEKSFE
jgi:hypothetical protein